MNTAEPLLTALRAIAEPTRLRLLALCTEAELTVSELVAIVGQSQPRVSRHLKLLTDAGLLERTREGSWVFHRLVGDGPGARLAHTLGDLLPHDDALFRADRDRLGAVKQIRDNAAAEYFRENAVAWDRLRSLHVDDDEVEGALLDLLPARPDGQLLDLGTGTGRLLEIFSPRFRRLEGVDLSREMLAVARSNLERASIANASVRQADIYQPPFAAESFDAVTIHQVLHFLDRPGQAIAEAARMLKDGGHMLIVDFAPHQLESLRHEHAHRRLGFDDAEVFSWCAAAGLEAKAARRLAGNPLTVAVWLTVKKPATPHSDGIPWS